MRRRAEDNGDVTQPPAAGMTPAQKRASLVAVACLALAGLYTLHEFLPALVWAVVFAIAVWPLFERAAARWPRHRRGLLPAVVVLGVLMIFVVPVTLAAIPLAGDAHGLAQWVDRARVSGVPAPALLGRLPYGDRLTGLWQGHLGQPGQISELTSHSLQGGLLGSGRRIASAAIHRLVLLAFMLVTLFFLLRQADTVVRQVKAASLRAFGPAGEKVGRQLVLSVHGTVNGMVLVGLAEGLLLGATYLVVGTPHGALLGLLTALLAMIPLGGVVAVGIAVLVLLAVGKLAAAIAVAVVGAIVIFVGDHFFRPLLVGGATRLPFIWVLLGILGGVSAWGLIGLFVGPAILAALILLWREWVGAQPGPLNPEAGEA